MQAQRPARTLRAANVAPDKDVTVTNAPSKQSFSAAGVFKKPRLPIRKKAHVTPKKNTRASRIPAAASSSIQKPPSGSARSSSASPQRAGQSKKSDMHPLALAFKDTSTAYRAHLYETVTTKLSTTLSTLVTSLYTCNLTAVSSTPKISDANASPVKLTLSAQYDRVTEKAFRPIGDYEVKNVHLHRDKTSETLRSVSLQELFVAFEEKHGKEVEQIRLLEAQWERVVGEIYKTGVACLGIEAMSAFLVEPPASSPSSPLFVPEHDSPPVAPKKRVTFQDPHHEYPSFLSGPSLYKNHPIAALPALAEDELKGLEETVGKLGVKQTEELRKIEVDQSKWWNKKCEQIAQTLRAD